MRTRNRPTKANDKKSMVLAGAAMIGIALLSGGAGAQGTPQTIELVKVDMQNWRPAIARPRSLAAASSTMPTKPSARLTTSS
jgi:hypothetical protein